MTLPEGERDPFLDQACDGDLYLQQQVKILLDTHKRAEHFFNGLGDLGEWFDVPMMPGLPAAEKQPTLDGAQIGPYRLLHSIGRGGMGQVYLAKRADEAFKQYVALKLIRRGMDTEDILRRFRTERQILASLAHPNIARLLDGGSTAEGLSYFVMEYVDGMPITNYCDRHRLSIDERLGLFRQVCQGVQYAHQNLIVHRDLKPSNILVTTDGVPKLLDFGIAKLLNPNLSGYSVEMTRAEQRVMTPEYASPEQVRGETITTASDVYSLGVLLYELLAGHRPYRLKSRLEAEVIRVICQEEPQRPSMAVSSVAAVAHADGTRETLTAEAISEARGASVERLRRRLQGDLDTIVLMALKKESGRRYGSVEQLSEDLRRYAEDLPVAARPDTVGYRARKFAGRHRVGIASAVVLVLLLAGFAVAMALQQAQTAQALDQAQMEAAKSAQVTDFLKEVFSEADPEKSRGASLSALELLDRGARKIEAELAKEPEIQAALSGVLADVYANLGLYDQSESLAQRSRSLSRQLFGNDHPEAAVGAQRLAVVMREQGAYDEATALLEEALRIRRAHGGDRDPEVAIALGTMASVAKDLGNYDEADSLYRQTLAIQRALLDNDHSETAGTLNNWGSLLRRMRRYDEAERVLREALMIRQRRYGGMHPEVATTMNNLAVVLNRQGNTEAAEQMHRETLALRRKLYDGNHTKIATSLNNLALVLKNTGRYAAADSFYREAVAMNRVLLGDQARLAIMERNYATLLDQQGKDDEADPYYREALAIFRSKLGNEHEETAGTLYDLGMVLLDKGALPEAHSLLQESLAIYRDHHPEEPVMIARVRVGVGACLASMGRYEDGEALLVQAHASLEEKQGPEDFYTRHALDHLIALYEAWGQPDKAAAYRARQTQE